MDWKDIYRELEQEPVVNSHCHHLRDEQHPGLGLEGVLRNSYVDWCGAPAPALDCGREEFEAWLAQVECRGYFVWLQRALRGLYGLEEPLGYHNRMAYDQAIREAHRDEEWHLKLLREKCRCRAVMQDSYWEPGSDNGHPELFRPAFRINSFCFGYNRAAGDHNGGNAQILYGQRISDIEEYDAFLGRVLEEKQQAGCAVVKCALAYDRSLAFGPGDKAAAQRAMRPDPSPEDVAAFQDYIMNRVCSHAARLGLPVQIHTGLGNMRGSRAMLLQPLIERWPDTVFLLMHGSYPWTEDIPGLTHVYPNVWADLCWLPLTSQGAAGRLLEELMDACDAGRIIWGCDTWTGEESFGARLAFLEVLSKALARRMGEGLMDPGQARRFAAGVLWGNAARLLGLRME